VGVHTAQADVQKIGGVFQVEITSDQTQLCSSLQQEFYTTTGIIANMHAKLHIELKTRILFLFSIVDAVFQGENVV